MKNNIYRFAILCVFAAAYITGFSLYAQNSVDVFSAFNSRLNSEEKEKLASGEILIRNIGKAKNMTLNPVTEYARTLIDTVNDLRPAYLAEVIQIRKLSGGSEKPGNNSTGENLIERIRPLLLDIESYVGIPYWSERNQRFYDLYSSAEILESKKTDTGITMNADLFMNPFGNINVNIELLSDENELLYTMQNNSIVKYENMTIIKKYNMKSLVYVFEYGDFVILYGIGGVHAPSVFFLRDRIETSFINRIKTFCKFIFEKI